MPSLAVSDEINGQVINMNRKYPPYPYATQVSQFDAICESWNMPFSLAAFDHSDYTVISFVPPHYVVS